MDRGAAAANVARGLCGGDLRQGRPHAAMTETVRAVG